MRLRKALFRRLLPLLGIILWVGIPALRAQEEAEEPPEVTQYREDYERYQKIAAVKDPMKRADQLVLFMKQRPNSQLNQNIRGDYLRILQDLFDAKDFDTLAVRAEAMTNACPRVGETYYFLGAALKEQNKYDEAMNALAKCYLLTNSASKKARQFLEFLYKSQNGNLSGVDAIIRKAREDLKMVTG